MGANESGGNILSTIISFLKRHKIIILGVLVGSILFMFGRSMKSSADTELAVARKQLSDIRNEIAQFDAKKAETQQVINHIDHGLNTQRWKADDSIITKWVQPAFAFKSGDEYVQNRDLFISRLGNSDPFVTQFMPSYTPKLQAQTDETAEPDYGQNMTCRMSSLKSYVTKIDEINDIYSYVAIVKCHPSIPAKYDYRGLLTKGNSSLAENENVVVITYDIAVDGAITNFNAFVKA